MLTKMTAFLARAPALRGLSLTVGDVGPAPYTAGLWCRGITVLDRRENLLGRVTQRCRAEFTLRPMDSRLSSRRSRKQETSSPRCALPAFKNVGVAGWKRPKSISSTRLVASFVSPCPR